ncbi:MAG TPA: hypothetical protein VIE66_21300 [Methylocella sp.]|jgi:hypothetical protein
MIRYFFSIIGGRPFNDIDGLELPDIEAARAEAIGLARDLMRMEPERQDWSSWSIHVTDEKHQEIFDLDFSEAV